MIKKINKDEYYLSIAQAVAQKSNCLCASFGCVIVKDDQIILTGYVGAPRKTKDCIEKKGGGQEPFIRKISNYLDVALRSRMYPIGVDKSYNMCKLVLVQF